MLFFFFKQKTAYEIRKGDWSSDVCSSDLRARASRPVASVRMNGIERGAQALNMVTAHESSPARRPGARALAALALTLGGCLSNPPGVRGVAGTAPAPNVFWTPPPPPSPPPPAPLRTRADTS